MDPRNLHQKEERAIQRALAILDSRLRSGEILNTSASVHSFLRLQSAGLPHEVFAILHLDPHNRLIAYERLFRGTLSRTSVYPREVVKQALAMNAASVILHHNHPTGVCIPSREDIAITIQLRSALALVDIAVLDHVITSDAGALSMAQWGAL